MTKVRKKKKNNIWARFYYSDERFDNLNDAQEARHDYAHLGFYVRIYKIPATKSSRQMWEIWIKDGPRLNYPRCCIEKKHWRVDDSKDKSTWIPREQAAKFSKKWIKRVA